MTIKGKILKGAYFDSVTLMIVGKELAEFEGVEDAAVVMGTKENISILKNSNLFVDYFKDAKDSDLLIAVKSDNDKVLEAAFLKADEILAKKSDSQDDGEEFTPKSIDGALGQMKDANMVMISVAGKYAFIEAMKALQNNLHVMLFSDNISIEQEVELKEYANKKGLLVMGPDCGTAIINGIPLAFANVVNRGDIGVVAAAGTGLQEVTTIVSNNGCGISQAIGTGGRDVKKEVSGLMFIQSIKALIDDENTKVILLVSKPPYEDVIKKIALELENTEKPIVSIFLSAPKGLLKGNKVYEAETLEEAAMAAVCYSKEVNPIKLKDNLSARSIEIKTKAIVFKEKLNDQQKYIRGLFAGGTFCTEAQLICKTKLNEIYSNAPLPGLNQLEDSMKSVAHTIIDLGEDEFTVGRPHPMIDFTLRNKRILEEAKDPETALILLDVVLGYGSNMNPIDELKDVLKEALGQVPVICSITGTDKDPQNRSLVKNALEELGVVVLPSNAAAVEFSLEVVA
ncbi:MAG: acyl-CoA synthetase FdrA [Pseudomonadota bacterium]